MILETPAFSPPDADAVTEKEISDKVSSAWQEELDQLKEGDDLSFFVAGGDSLSLAAVIGNLARHFDLDPMDELWDAVYVHPTRRKMKAVVAKLITQKKLASPAFYKGKEIQISFLGGCYQLAAGLLVPVALALLFLVVYQSANAAFPASAFTTYVSAWIAYQTAFFACIALLVITKWCLIGKFQEGFIPIGSCRYYSWWTIKYLHSTVHCLFWPLLTLSRKTCLISFIYRLLGVKIGKDCTIFDLGTFAYDLVSVGKGSVLGESSFVCNDQLKEGILYFGSVTIGEESWVKSFSAVRGGMTVPDRGTLKPDGSFILRETAPGCSLSLTYKCCDLCVSLFLLPILFTGIFFSIHQSIPLEGGISGVLSGVLFLLILGFLRRLFPLNRKRYPYGGAYHFWSRQLKKTTKIADQFMSFFGGTLIYTLWLKVCGLKAGKRCFINPNTNIIDHLEWIFLGQDVFVSFCRFDTIRHDENQVEHRKISIGDGVSVGLEASIEPGVRLEAGSAIGSCMCIDTMDSVPAYHIKDRFGLRPKTGKEKKYSLPYAGILLHSMLRLVALSLLVLAVFILNGAGDRMGFSPIVAYLCMPYLAPFFLWMWMLPFSRCLKPNKSSVGQNSGVQFLVYSGLVMPLSWCIQNYFFRIWKGTPLMNGALRALGAKIGKRSVIFTEVINDWKMIAVGENSLINDRVRITGHTLAQGGSGVFMLHATCIGNYCTICSGISLVPPANIPDGALIDENHEVINYSWKK